jgi:glutaredoxin-like protein
MALLKDEDRKKLEELFAELKGDVRIVFFTQEMECQFCALTRQMVEELTAVSPRLSLEIKDFVKDKDAVRRHGIDKVPAIVLEGERDYGIRFYGVPGGYEFTALVEDILEIGRREPDLTPKVREQLEKVDKPVHMQVLVSPTCPYCTTAVRTAHRFAMASEHIRADMVEVSEFPHLAVKYDVQGVPVTIINEEHRVVGAVPEAEVAEAVLHAIGQ